MQASDHARAFVRELGAEPFDLVLNLTNSGLANLLCALVPSREVRGGRHRARSQPGGAPSVDDLLLGEPAGARVRLREPRRSVLPRRGGAHRRRRARDRRARDGRATACDDGCRQPASAGEPLVALQLGASDERKRWTPEQFAAMANRLPARAGTIVLVGSAAERPLGDARGGRPDAPASQRDGRDLGRRTGGAPAALPAAGHQRHRHDACRHGRRHPSARPVHRTRVRARDGAVRGWQPGRRADDGVFSLCRGRDLSPPVVP